jgi:hypothetical protein
MATVVEERTGRRQQSPAQTGGGRLPHQVTPVAIRCPGLALPIVALVALADGRQAASLKLRSANRRLLGRRDGCKRSARN